MRWMMSRTVASTVAMIAITGLVLAGCQTRGGSAAAGAAIGAGAGAAIGSQSGKTTEGALIGAAVGALAGLIAYEVRANKTKNREATARDYEHETNEPMLRIEDTDVTPNLARRGELVETLVQYALLGTGDAGTSVRETRVLKRGADTLAQLSSKNFTRTDGTWVSSLDFKVPTNLSDGVYTVETIVEAQGEIVSANADFSVRGD